MSKLEKKALAFEKLAALQKNEAIEEIILLLDKLNNEIKSTLPLHAGHKK